MSAFFSRPWAVLAAATLFRVGLLFYGCWQDANSPMKYTDIDYLVFTDAARFVAHGRSPYDRATYRYTPLLAWLLYPTTWAGLWFEFGKAIFAAGDVVTGWLIYRILRQRGMATDRAMQYASIWLLNPMVANISTRGSSEGLLAVLVIALLWATLQRRIWLAGALLGFGVHFKIYPFIYAASIFWWLGDAESDQLTDLFNASRVKLAVTSFVTFTVLNAVMYTLYVSSYFLVRWNRSLSRMVGTAMILLSIATPITSPVSTIATISQSTIHSSILPQSKLRALACGSSPWLSSRRSLFHSSPCRCCLQRRILLGLCWHKRSPL